MKSYTLILGLFSVVAAGVFFFQQQSIARLREQNRSLSQQLQRMAQLQSENEQLSSIVARIGHPPADSELLRLRSEVTMLHLKTNEIARSEQDNRTLAARLKQDSHTLAARVEQDEKDMRTLARLIRERQDAFANGIYYVTNTAGFWVTPDLLQLGTVLLGPGGIRIWPQQPELNAVGQESTANRESEQNATVRQERGLEEGFLITPDMFEPGTALHFPGGLIVPVPK